MCNTFLNFIIIIYVSFVIVIIRSSTDNAFSAKTEKLLSWMNDLHPDPNDPNNASFFEALKVTKLNIITSTA